MLRTRLLGALALVSAVAVGGAAGCAGSGAEGGAAQEVAAAACANRGRGLFLTHCAVCHGNSGRGDGKAAYLLSPAARDFGAAKFRLVSTVNGAPTHEDLLSVLRNGMPGSAMPAWEWMPRSDLDALASYVRELAVAGRADDLQRRAEEDDEELPREEALDIATRALTPGDPIPIPPECAPDPLSLQAGRRFFLQNCAQCHGVDGTGRGGEPQINEDGTPAHPRDFTAGILKGGSSHADVIRRVTGGLPGSPMPATKFDDPLQAAQLSAYVRSLIKPGMQERVALHAQVLGAARIAERAPRSPRDPAWSKARSAWLPLAPLWWRERRVEGCVVSALHDGETLAIKLSWEDSTKDDDLLGQDSFTDAVALQWSRAEWPPMLSMGDPGRPVNIWQWRAGWELDLDGARDLAARFPRMPDDQYGMADAPSAPLYVTARASGNPMAAPSRVCAAEMLTAEGLGTLRKSEASDSLLGTHAEWSNGFWDVVLTRSLSVCCPGEAPLTPGSSLFLAVAVWDGAQHDRNGQKSVSVWHTLRLDP